MAHALVQSKVGGNGVTDPTAVTFDNPTANGNLIEVAIGGRHANNANAASVSVTDDAGNTYVECANTGNLSTALNDICWVYRAYNASPANTVTVNYTEVTTNLFVLIVEHSGLTTSDPLDQTATGGGLGTAVTTGNTGTLAQADELVTCYATARTGDGTWTVGATYSDTNTTAGQIAGEHKIVAATSAVAGAFTYSASRTWRAVLCTYLIDAGGGANPVPSIMHNYRRRRAA